MPDDRPMSDTTTTDILEARREAALAIHRAAEAGDFETVLAAYDPGIVWVNDPGAGPWAGRFEGIEAVARMFGEYLDFLEGTFTMEVLDVCASPDRTTSFLVERATKAGRPYENRAVWITRWQGDVVVEVITVDLDRDDALEFWRSVTA
jgi:ketosteroid isomerase-like protein